MPPRPGVRRVQRGGRRTPPSSNPGAPGPSTSGNPLRAVAYNALKAAVQAAYRSGAGRGAAVTAGAAAYRAAGGTVLARPGYTPEDLAGGYYDTLANAQLSGFEQLATGQNPIVNAVFDKVRPFLKIAAGGAVMMLAGGALVYVAGRNTPPGQALGAVNTTAGKVASKVAPQRTAERRAVRDEVASQRRASARRSAAFRVTTDNSGVGGRVKVARRSKAETTRASQARARYRIRRERLGRLRSQPRTHTRTKASA